MLLQDLLGLELSFTQSEEEFVSSQTPKINYSRNAIPDGVFIQSTSLLFDTDISQQEFQKSEYDGVPVFFMTGKQSQLPFDPFAAAFYLVSRYEEYMPFIADEHNRFPAKESLQYKWGCLDRPLVNEYVLLIEKTLRQFYPQLEFNKPEYSFTNSIDIDNAYAYLGKGLVRTVGGYINDLISLDFKSLGERTRVIWGKQNDPYETFEHHLGLQEKYGYPTIYFALFSKMGQYDRSLTMLNPKLQNYIKGINDFCDVGIHPSYRSNGGIDILEEEVIGLEQVLKEDITKSRQHFLKLKFPETYRNLIDLEITDDYTMGYAAEAGFRAGICTPFKFYDLELEVETPLTVHPFPFMDGTFIYYKSLKPDEAYTQILDYILKYKRYGGEFIPIWHNRIFSEQKEEWKGWNNLFEEMVKAAL